MGKDTAIFDQHFRHLAKVLFKRVLYQEPGFFDRAKIGDVTSRLNADTTKLTDQISLNLNVFLRSVLSAVRQH